MSQNTNQPILFDPNILNDPLFQSAFHDFVTQRRSNNNEYPTQLNASPRNTFPVSQHILNNSPGIGISMSQNIDQYPTTPGGDDSSNRTPIISQEVEAAQGGDDDDDDEDEAEQVTKGKEKVTKERWGKEEDKVLVSGYLNCGGDPEEGTDQTKSKLWKEIKRIYDTENQRRSSIIHPRTMKSIKRCWATINECVTLWVSQLGEAERMRLSGMAIENVEERAHELYSQKKNGKNFTFYHCWVEMKHLPRWMTGKDSTVISQGSSKRSTDDACLLRPDGVKKVKAQRKSKGVSTSLDDFNTTLSGMQESRGMIAKHITNLIDYQKERDAKKMRFKMFSLFMSKSYLEPEEAAYLEKLKQEFMQ
ncbi:hypothetical protein RND81_10G097400 [Saponaria officinalis]|uniref:Myb-like domain-containing protein n=1 Tax=Saponaria officinalis TaxID=3572 RepID=A0AAW1I0A3_SAPOF